MISDKTTSSQKKYLVISLILFAISLTQNAYTINDLGQIKKASGFEAFFMGGLAFLGGGFFEWLIWLANPLYFLAVFFRKRNIDNAIAFGWMALILSLSFSLWRNLLAAENGRSAIIQSKGLGYIIWLISQIVWLVGLLITRSDSKAYKMASDVRKEEL